MEREESGEATRVGNLNPSLTGCSVPPFSFRAFPLPAHEKISLLPAVVGGESKRGLHKRSHANQKVSRSGLVWIDRKLSPDSQSHR